MSNSKLIESVSVATGILFVFLVQNSALSTYSSYLLALVIIFMAIYITLKKRSKTASQLFTGNPIELFSVTTIITFIISLTNGLASPLFFFLYFLIFLLAFMAESITIWFFLGSILLYFIPQASNSFTMDTLIKLGSLILISPIAYFIAREFERRQRLDSEIEVKTEEIIQEAQALKEAGSAKTQEESDAINTIIEEATSLKEDSEIN